MTYQWTTMARTTLEDFSACFMDICGMSLKVKLLWHEADTSPLSRTGIQHLCNFTTMRPMD